MVSINNDERSPCSAPDTADAFCLFNRFFGGEKSISHFRRSSKHITEILERNARFTDAALAMRR